MLSHMSFKIAWLRAGKITMGAFVGLLTRVLYHVRFQISGMGARVITLLALVTLDAGMHPHMYFQVISCDKREVALTTGEGLLTSVPPHYVHFQLCGLNKRTFTLFAFVWLFSSVLSHVYRKIT